MLLPTRAVSVTAPPSSMSRPYAPSEKQSAHTRQLKADALRRLLKARRKVLIPSKVLKDLAALQLPPDPEIYTKHLQKLLRAEGRC
jgi:hypothetical protein